MPSDCHIHLMGRYRRRPAALVADLDRHEIARAVLFAAPTREARGIPVGTPPWLARMVGGTSVGRALTRATVDRGLVVGTDVPENDAVLDAVRRWPDRLRMLLFLDLRRTPSPDDLSLLDSPLVAGVKAHLLFQPCSLLRPDLKPVWRAIEASGKCLLVDLGLRPWAAAELGALAAAHSEARFIAPHLEPSTMTLARHLPNVYVDMAGMHIDVRRLRAAVRAAGVRKVLFGSDAPKAAGGDIGHALRTVGAAFPDPAERRRITDENFEVVFGPAFGDG